MGIKGGALPAGGVGCPAASRPLLCPRWKKEEEGGGRPCRVRWGCRRRVAPGLPRHIGAGLLAASGEGREEQGGTKREGGVGGVGNGRGWSAGRADGAWG